MVSLPRAFRFLMIVVNSYFDDLSSFWNPSPGALNFYEFLFSEKFVKCI